MARLIEEDVAETTMSREPCVIEAARQSLQRAGIPALMKIYIDASPESLILTGSVPSFYYKQLAQELTRSCCGHRKLLNHICVRTVCRTPT